MLASFRLGGFPMIPTALFGAMLMVVALKFAWKPEQRWIPLQIALAILTLVTGALGFVLGVAKCATNLGSFEPSRALHIFTIGFGESIHNLALALFCVALAAMAVCVGALRLTAEAE
jgi:hypothetical protein